jgi:hypothetical protein
MNKLRKQMIGGLQLRNYSVRWILSLSRLAQNWGQVQPVPNHIPA